jgi:hypothetical protein
MLINGLRDTRATIDLNDTLCFAGGLSELSSKRVTIFGGDMKVNGMHNYAIY